MATVHNPARPAEPRARGREIEVTMARWIGLVLRTGVYLAGALIALGTLLVVLGQGQTPSRDAALGKGVEIPSLRPGDIVHGLARGDGPALIQLGLLLLILTPVSRVGLTVILFSKQRDRIFVALAGGVFVILLLGLAGIGA